ncbi:hypothetical protein OHA38_43835 (plasmid) [Streptomyces sp. NBC_01732]|uniref:hypothetical protein n=1 Tax=Streptomyces sp. NBC_01732 TaxID=2975926 RepID=UPI00352DC891|nr:hypothetical protein OHA38_43835 [Streptomyces sp. NBC_01732]
MSPSAKGTIKPDEPAGLRPKYVPLRKDQYTDLSDLARDLQDARSRKTERITENTLIRAAIDLITSHPELLAGDTEEEIRSGALARIRAWAAAEAVLVGNEGEEPIRAWATAQAALVGDTEEEIRSGTLERIRAWAAPEAGQNR